MKLSKYISFFIAFLLVSGSTGVLAQTTFSFGKQPDNTTATTGNTGLADVFVGGGGGSWTLKSPGNTSLGHYTELRGIPGVNSTINSITGTYVNSPGTLFTLEYDVLFNNGTGDWYTFIGTGTSFLPGYNGPFSGSETFAGIRYSSVEGVITVSLRSAQSWKSSGITMSPNTPYRITFVCNNSEGTYPYNGGGSSVGAGRYDIWVNGVLVDNEVVRTHPAFAGKDISTFKVYGNNSGAKDYAIVLDNIREYNTAVMPLQCPKPISLTANSIAQTSAVLSWAHHNMSQPTYVVPDSQVIRWRKVGGGAWNSQNIAGNASNFNATGLQMSTQYEWNITTYKGEEYYSNASTFTTASCSVNIFPWVHDFSSNNSCWATNDVVGTSTNWTFNASLISPTLAPTYGNTIARFNSRGTTSGDAEMLISPVLDFSSLTNPVLEFSYSQDAGFPTRNEDLFVVVSVNNGPFSDTVRAVTRVKAGSAVWSLNGAGLDDYAGVSNVRLGFLAVSKNGSNLGLDMVRVFNASCPVPNHLVASSIGSDTAVLSWTTVIPSDTFAVMYREVGTNPWTIRLMYNPSNSLNVSHTIADLQPGITYQWRVRTSCDDVMYNYTNAEFFTTNAGCRMPYSLNNTGITQTGATLNWNHPGADTFYIAYRMVGNPTWSYAYSATNSYSLGGLSIATSYQWRVRAKCSGYPLTNFASAIIFTTNSPKTLNIPAATVYPNPTSNAVVLNFQASSENYTIQVRDNLGRTVRTLNGQANLGNNTVEMNLEQPAGIYFIEIQAGSTPQNIKVVVQ
ncbi:MAG: fibronectin type III domain-containing protein [Bacteroidia bacterium]|nr:fibronectin type III domain-containing protein [Bacteroidia bacterium]